MAGAKQLLIALFLASAAIGSQRVGAQVHHVVGGDRGWDTSSDVGAWSSGRNFRVGDKIWFTYSAAQENLVELKSKEEYESCDISNPIKMYTDGLDSFSLDREEIRYFASGKAESCKNGLKLHLEVQSQANPLHHVDVRSEGSDMATADAPTTPSASTHLNALSNGLFVGFLLFYVGL